MSCNRPFPRHKSPLRCKLQTGIARRQASARFEWLEARLMLASAAWAGGLTGNWDVAANWSPAGVPTSTTAVSIATSGATVTIAPGETESADSLSIAAGATLSMPAGVNATNPTTNLLSDSDFELSPLPSYWWNWGSGGAISLSTQYAYTGLQSLDFSGTGYTAVQYVPATPGTSYTASVYAMTPAALTGYATVYLNLYFFGSSGQITSSYAVPNTLTMLTASSATGGPLAGSVGSLGWNHFYTTAVAPAGTINMEAQVETAGCAATAAVYFDDLVVGPTPSGAAGSSKLNAGSISNSGTLSVAPTNTVTISGTFAQTSTGTLDIQLGGAPSTGDFGFVNASGAATLAGTLKADVVNGYSPATTDTFTPIEFASKSGTFASDTMPSGSGYQFDAAVSFTNVMISAAPTAALTATVNASTSLHAVATNLLGVNTAYWDSDAATTQTQTMMTAAGLDIYRFPGGAAADAFHFNMATNWSDSGAITIPQFVQFVTSVGGTGMITVDYGSGSPQEAAAELAYVDGSPTDTTSIGSGIEWIGGAWSSSSDEWVGGSWQTVDWKTVGYWASLRGASPLATDDGLNFMRIAHPAAFTDIKYWEIGNEEYGGNAEWGYWEIDHHGTTGPNGSTGATHDPATYATFAAQFAALASEIQTTAGQPQISIGIDSGDPTGTSNSDMVANWTKNVLADGAVLTPAFIPGFISDHSYMQAAGTESDSFLLDDTVSLSGSSNLLNWSTRCSDYQTVLQQTLASQASSVQIMATEYNSVSTDPGKQSASLVNGLFVAESLGGLLESGYSGAFVWNLRNYYDTSQNNSNLLYGWREGGDYGLLGSTNENSPPTTGPYVAYPDYYALQLASKIIQSGGQVVSATSNYGDLDVYAVEESSGDLELLVINVNPAASLTERFNLTGFQPGGPAQVWQYGETQDTAQSQSSNGASALASISTSLSLSGANFSYTFPAYSMTVLDLTPAPTVVAQAAATSSPVTGASTALSVLGGYNGGESNLTYTWATSGTPPAAVSFSVNGTNAAKNTTATFSKAGTYSFSVTITDPNGISTTNSTTVTVSQTFTSVSLSPGTSSLNAGGSQQFAASALDQFGNALVSQPAFTWSLTGGGSLTTAGLYTPPYASGTATVKAASGTTSGTAAVTLSGQAQWVSSVAAPWTTSGDWKSTVSGTAIAAPGVRGITGDTVLFGSSVVGAVDLNGASPSLGAVTFNDPSGATIASGTGGSLQLNNGASPATIAVAAGSDTISAPLVLGSNLLIDPAPGNTLNLSGAISGAGKSLTVGQAGTVVLSGTNSYSGGTVVSAGTLIVTSASAIADGTSLMVGAGGVFAFPSSEAVSSVVVAAATSPIAGLADMTGAPAATFNDPRGTTATPVALPLPVSPPGSPTGNPSRFVLAGAADTPPAKLAVWSSIVDGQAWLGQAADSSNDFDQHHKNDAALLALEAVFAQYGQ